MDTIRRRIVVTIELNADSWEEAANALSDVQVRILEAHERKEPDVRVTSSDASSNWHLTGNEDPSIDHDSYTAQVKLFQLGRGFDPIY